MAQADAIRAAIAKENIQAPFAAHLGIRLVNLGQIFNEGEPIASLQSIDPIFVNFSLPQQQLAQVQTDLIVRVKSDPMPGHVIEGRGYTLNYTGESRQLRVEATQFLSTFTLAIIMIFLALAAQFNSFRDPFVTLAGSVPLALFVIPSNYMLAARDHAKDHTHENAADTI